MLHFQYGEKGRIGRFEGEEVQYEARSDIGSCDQRSPGQAV